MTDVTLRLPEPTWARLREQAHQENTTITALIIRALDYPGSIEKVQPNFGWPDEEGIVG